VEEIARASLPCSDLPCSDLPCSDVRFADRYGATGRNTTAIQVGSIEPPARALPNALSRLGTSPMKGEVSR
jgi:hypothetical protein